MMRIVLSGVLSVAMLAATAGQTQASQTFDFSFTSSANPNGYVLGTVTGEVVLPFNGDGTGAATEVLIDSFPSALDPFPPPTPFLITPISQPFPDGVQNTFVVTGGNVSYANFLGADYYWTGTPPWGITLNLDPNGPSALLSYLSPPPTNQTDIGAPVQFVPAPSPTPEPASIPLLVSGFLTAGGFGLVRRRRRAVIQSPVTDDSSQILD
jgi:hypothetical protein